MLNKEQRPHRGLSVKHKKISRDTQRVSKKLIISLILAFTAVIIYGVGYKYTADYKKTQELRETYQQLQLKEQELQSKDQDSIQKQQEIENLNKQLEETKAQLEARLAQKRALAEAESIRAQENATQSSYVARTTVSGSKQDWLIASGIPESEWWAVDSIVSGESSWNPNNVNPHSGACGLGQQLPCGKWDAYGPWNDPVSALRAMNDYVQAYGGWAEAVAFRNCTGTCWSNRTNSYVYKDHTWY